MIAKHASRLLLNFNRLQKVNIVPQLRCISLSRDLFGTAMEDAKTRVTLLKEDPGNEAKLKLYALYKQATTGKCNVKKPGVFDFVGAAKWNAWNELGDISKEDAEKQYVAYVNELAGGEETLPKEEENKDATSGPSYDGLEITKENGICTIKFNRPNKLNALTPPMYNGIRDTLNEAAKDDSIKIVVLTGNGKFYCSGNDLSNFMNIPKEGPKKLAEDSREILWHFVNSFINFPKLLVCAINGPALGISVTVLALADLIYASDVATFHTPFMSLGQSPEGCSSYTFPKLMGSSKANEILLAGKKLTAYEALERNLVTSVIPDNEFQKTIEKKLAYLNSLPPKSLMYSKALEREREKETLIKVNEVECDRLKERWLSDECAAAVMKFLSKSKSSKM